MSDKAPWRCPDWMGAENVERYERMVEALHDTVRAVRACADRLTTANDVTAWEFRVTAITADADEWARRLAKVAPKDQGEAA